MTSRKIYYELEKVFKGVSNHRRLEVLFLLNTQPNLSTDDIVEKLNINYQTGSQHIRKLVGAGLVSTHRKGSAVLHVLSPLGVKVLYFSKNI
ncbi:MAG: hypothetical protein A2653_01800 [Candidatus Zambryskibacteria bacterium RIFCSPHIGHO2_01_FULL_43_25]|uniref:HTH arsR-type domain-containing protein n=1 Tax=Candidatus Zambryskibacteria bacterium RIFCSPLOWO2_01_FULL_45_21 TaxID=1802761 RepID=A0A1G2U1G4_9BACT|nr:MAG: hypothetical protein A2653_01800 [Candidatus Zambryskibacteria bacterium RIFCSPHIGHO2_01_FULL_43_25]OHB01094.1 MAG: hypothetical protein A3E94_00565 [Candidatus Zambryskibacteria bacterium RIFCSPHIGHO2_12_FULL_44_12b]OHB03355.1 MAG: hypothetical protein A3B14_00400 [Candidatus Zambryskibacteria bacterium RIFCSPLOWO2_01_FULL_45_21]